MADDEPTNSMPYSWRKVAQDRWLCIDDNSKHIVGTILKEGPQRHRIQLRSSDGILLLHPVVFNRFGTARQILLSKLKNSALKDLARKSDDTTEAAIAAASTGC
jgi:hypothetical protein